jgi:anti-anti-sigma regulatory factor
MLFELAARGSVFSTRDRGTILLAELEDQLAADPDTIHRLVLDFAGVRDVSHSFADEFVANAIARAKREGWPDPELANMNDMVARVVRRALRDHDLQCV